MTGFGVVMAWAWRCCRFFYLCWTLSLIGLLPLLVVQYERLFPSDAGAAAMAVLLAGNPTMRALFGPPFDLLSAGGFAFWRTGTMTAAGVAMMSALGVVRSTRAEEEEGRDELIRAGAVSRHTPLLVAITLAGAVGGLVGALTAGLLVAVGAPVAGSVASGLGLGLTGVVYAAVAAVIVQSFESARTVRIWTLGAAWGGSYLLRALVDGMGEGSAIEFLQWMIPLEWAALARPYADERWWVFGLHLVLTLALIALAFGLESRRDHRAGLFAARTGPAMASPSLATNVGLAWRIQRNGVIGWTVGLVVTGISLGTLSGFLEELVQGNERFYALFRATGGNEANMSEAFFVMMLGLLAVAVAAFSLQMMSCVRAEEVQGRVEWVLSTSLSRPRFLFSHLWLAAFIPSLLLVVLGILLPLPDMLDSGGVDFLVEAIAAAAVLSVGVLFMLALAVLAVGWRPTWLSAVWAVLGWAVFAVWIGPLLDLPEEVLRIQPWGYLPKLPSESMVWSPVLVELALSVLLLTLGVIGYRRRHIPMP